MKWSQWVVAFFVTVCCAAVVGCSQGLEGSPSGASGGSTTSLDVSVGELEQLIVSTLEGYGSPGGFVLLHRDGTEVFAAAGSATSDGGEITPDSTFRIASISKPIVAALVMSQIEAGALALDDSLSSHLPGVVSEDDEITLRMLLDHSSGIFDPQDGDPIGDIPKLTDPELRREAAEVLERYLAGEQVVASDRLVVAMAEAHPHYFEPGSGFHYSNTNYQVLGMVLASATGDTLQGLFGRVIARPLGLIDTAFAPPDLNTPDIHGYGISADDGRLIDLTDDVVTFGNGASGGVVSTPIELLTMMRAIVAGDLIGEESMREMRGGTPQSGFAYGLGLAAYETGCGLFYGHEGGVNGMASIAMSSTDGSDAVVIGLNMRGAEDPGLPVLANELLCGS